MPLRAPMIISRDRLGWHDALVFGANFLQFFRRINGEKSGMDLNVKTEDGANAFEEYLGRNEGYKLVNT